jgi:hypothetical protein
LNPISCQNRLKPLNIRSCQLIESLLAAAR